MQRIDRIQSTLSSDLDHLFSSTVVALTAPKEGSKSSRSTESDKAKWIADVTECLLTYDSLGLWQDAEEILRRDVVHEFIKRVIMLAPLSEVENSCIRRLYTPVLYLPLIVLSYHIPHFRQVHLVSSHLVRHIHPSVRSHPSRTPSNFLSRRVDSQWPMHTFWTTRTILSQRCSTRYCDSWREI